MFYHYSFPEHGPIFIDYAWLWSTGQLKLTDHLHILNAKIKGDPDTKVIVFELINYKWNYSKKVMHEAKNELESKDWKILALKQVKITNRSKASKTEVITTKDITNRGYLCCCIKIKEIQFFPKLYVILNGEFKLSRTANLSR